MLSRAITCVAIAMSIWKYIVPISSKEDSEVRQSLGNATQVILHSSASSEPISGSNGVVLQECGHDGAIAREDEPVLQQSSPLFPSVPSGAGPNASDATDLPSHTASPAAACTQR